MKTFAIYIYFEKETPTNVKIVIIETKRPSGEHSRRHNRPLSDDIAVLMPNDATTLIAVAHYSRIFIVIVGFYYDFGIMFYTQF